MTPGKLADDIKSELINSFEPEEALELSLGLGLFHGFSKLLIALGREPEEMETTVIPTPTAPEKPANFYIDSSHELAGLLAPSPNLRDRWLHLEESLWEMDAFPTAELRAIQLRIAKLLGVPDEYLPPIQVTAKADLEFTHFADSFLFDIRSITSKDTEEIRGQYGDVGLLHLMMCLAIYDGIYRVASTQIHTSLDQGDTE